MQRQPLYPLIFTPVYKDYIWGGDRIIRRYRRTAPPGIYAESWEISDRPEDMSLVVNGYLAGQSLHALVQDYGKDLVGTMSSAERFPILMKLLDARDRLSVQVHPDDDSAQAGGGEPKTEMWYILDAAPGAMVFAGVKPDVTAAQFRAAIQAGTVPELLTPIPVVAGDVIFIPGGRIHAVGAGCLLLEVQQNSNTTYRVFDWDRVGLDGKPRPLHIEKALKTIRWNDPRPARLPAPDGTAGEGMIRERFVSPYFRMDHLTVEAPLTCSTGGLSFHILFVEDGAIRMKDSHVIVAAEAGTTFLVPAAIGVYEITGQQGLARVIRISLP